MIVDEAQAIALKLIVQNEGINGMACPSPRPACITRLLISGLIYRDSDGLMRPTKMGVAVARIAQSEGGSPS